MTSPKSKRLIWLVVLVVVVSLYFPINRMAEGGVVLETTLDPSIPLAPVWIIPYLSGLALFILVLLWAYRKMPSAMYASFVTTNLIAAGVAYTIYLVYPTFVLRPTITGTDTLSRWMAWLYAADRAYNAFPSSHTFYTVIAWLYLWGWQPRLRIIATVMAILIILSTLFTKQHHIPDLVAGVILGVASFWVGQKLASRLPGSPLDNS